MVPQQEETAGVPTLEIKEVDQDTIPMPTHPGAESSETKPALVATTATLIHTSLDRTLMPMSKMKIKSKLPWIQKMKRTRRMNQRRK